MKRTSALWAGAALTLALALAACGRSPEVAQAPSTDDSTARPAFVTTPGSLASVSTAPFGANAFLKSVAFQSDGKMVAAGYINTNFAVARYNTDGTVDPSFSGDGLVTTDLIGDFEEVNAVRLQPDGKIVAVGRARNSDRTSRLAVARYNPNGSLDPTFDGDGKKSISLDANTTGHGVAVQTLGGQVKIVVTGLARGAGEQAQVYCVILRLNTNGGFDTGFSGDGATAAPGCSGALGVQPDGKIVVGGGRGGTLTLRRYNTNGSLDASFGGGQAEASFGSEFAQEGVRGLTVQPDGRIVAVGQVYQGGGAWAIARFKTDGSPDGRLTVSGFVPGEFPGSNIAQDVALQADGKVVVAGTTGTYDYQPESNIYDYFALVRLNPDLSLDTTFGGDGKVYTESGVTLDRVLRVRVTSQRIMVAGYTVGGGSPLSFALAQYFR